MQTVKGVKVRCIKLLKNKVYKFARYSKKITIRVKTKRKSCFFIQMLCFSLIIATNILK